MYRAIRERMHREGFIDVETPVRVSAAGTDPFLEAVGCEDDTCLQTSPEFAMKSLLAQGHERVFQICKAFRGKEITPLHNPEFTILEFYRAWDDMDAVIQDVEDIVKVCVPDLQGTQFARRTMSDVVRSAANIDLLACQTSDDFRRAIQEQGHFEPRKSDGWHEMFFEMIVTCVDPYLEKQPPTFVTHWPSQVAVLARRSDSDPRVALRFELYVEGLELCNGFEELTDPTEQRRRFEEDRDFRRQHGLPDAPMPENFLKALEWGLPPSAGVAIGLDRVLMLRTKTKEISDVLPFWWGAVRF
jgi:lysyl-tRNA synthetase class 2